MIFGKASNVKAVSEKILKITGLDPTSVKPLAKKRKL
jgi:hypothetical protein